MRPSWLPAGDSFLWPVLTLLVVGALVWWRQSRMPARPEREITVEFCDAACAARAAGHAFAQSRAEAIDAECARKGEEFRAGCVDYWEERAPDDMPEDPGPPDDD